MTSSQTNNIINDSQSATLSRTSEKLIILLDYSIGLLTRVHACVHYKRGSIFRELDNKIIDHLSQKKEDPTKNYAKQNGSQIIQMKSEALENETRFCYETIGDILLFSNEVIPLFLKLVKNIMIFDIHRNTDLTSRFLGVFFNFVKIHLLASRMTDGRIAAYLYILSFHEHYRKDPEEAHLVKKFIFMNSSPLKYLQFQLKTLYPRIADVIQDGVQNLLKSFLTWTSYEEIKKGQYFNLSQKNPITYSHPIDDDLELYQDATYLDNVGTWIIYLYLLFPQKLVDEIPRNQLTAALTDRTVVILFRDELIDAIHEYKSLRRTSTQNEMYNVPRQIITKIIQSINMDGLAQRHRQMRELLRREIRGLLDISQTLPGVIAVKLPMFMASLALARYEIYWVFTHMSLKDSKHKLKASSLNAPYLPDLMFHEVKLLKTILANKKLIHEYYGEQLKLDIKEIIPFAQQMKKQGRIDISILNTIEYIIKEISALNKNNNNDNNDSKDDEKSISIISMEGLRLNWYRASSELSKEPSILNRPEGQAIVKLVNPLIEHTRFYDRLEKEVDARGSMASLWFYRSFMASIFNNYCLGKISLDNSRRENFRQGRYWIVFLQIFSNALQNVHRQHPGELDHIGLQALQKSEAYLNGATSKIEVCLRNILGQYSKWNSQIQTETVADTLIANRGQKMNYRNLPGFESLYQMRQYLDPLKYNLDTIGDMCASCNEVDSIIIHNQRIYPSAYIYQLMNDFFFQELRLLVQESSKTMVRPTRFVSRLERLFRAISRVGEYINLNLEKMVKKLLYCDFFDYSVGDVGGALGMPRKKKINDNSNDVNSNNNNNNDDSKNDKNNKKNKKKLIHDIRDWYVGLVDSRCATPNSGAVYSPILDGFYDIKSSSIPLEDYCSLTELESLCKIIGPAGVRIIDIEIVKIGHAAMQKISTVLKKNKDLISGVDMYKFYDQDRWQNIVKKFNGLDIISQQGVVVGSVILFRQLLRKSLYNIINDTNNFYTNTVDKLHKKLHYEKVYFEQLSHLGLDVGIVSNFTDNVMRNVFYQLSNTNTKMWQYIPLVFGICFADSFWKNNTSYNMKLGALTNNGFAMANAVSTLISIFTEQSGHRKNKLLFLDIAGRTLLYLKKINPNNKSINNIFLFLDYFIDICDDLTPMDLQSFSVPYDIIRAQLVQSFGDASGLFTDAQLAINNPSEQKTDN